MLDGGGSKWASRCGVLVAVLIACALSGAPAGAAAFTFCGPGRFVPAARTHTLPKNIDVGIAKDTAPGQWVECETPVYYMNWFAPTLRNGRDTGATHVEERGRRCLAAHCAVIVDLIVTAVVTKYPRPVYGRAYVDNGSFKEEHCGLADDTCNVQDVVGILTRGESANAVCAGWGGKFRYNDKISIPFLDGEIHVFCSAWMIPSGGTCPVEGKITSVHPPGSTGCGRYPKAPNVPKSERPSRPGEEPQPPGSNSGGPGPNCSRDDPESPPPPGCERVTVRVIPAPLPSDPGNESIGEGVGSATLEPGGATVHCLNPGDAEACVITADVPANTPASVSAQPGSLAGYPSSPSDSAFYKFAGACTGTSTCTFTPAPGSTVDVYFIPAMVTLTLQATGDEGHANMTANEFAGGGLEPIPPVYCGFTYPGNPLPCHVQVRVGRSAQVEANSAGDPQVNLQSFSSNCSASSQGPSFCIVRMMSDQTVTARFDTLMGGL